jgi:O-acetylhomoserine/O-acetylserine sulfhydrylase-like pyridoxal-dependent enzyme
MTQTNPYAHLKIVDSPKEAFALSYAGVTDTDWKHTFFWSDAHKVAAEHLGIELPLGMTKAEAWDFLLKVKTLQPRIKKHQKHWQTVIRIVRTSYGVEVEKVLLEMLK